MADNWYDENPGMKRPQVQDEWGRSPGDLQWGVAPTASPAVPGAPQQQPTNQTSSQTQPWGGFNNDNIWNYGYGQDLNPLSQQTGVSRDDLAAQRDAFLQPLEQKYRDATGGGDATSQNLTGSQDFRNFIQNGQMPGSVAQQQTQAAQPSAMTQWTGSATGATSTPVSPENDARKNSLFDMLMGRAQQGLGVSRTDPAVRAQADAYSANEERARRNYISDYAEKAGPYANTRGAERMASEKSGQRSGAFEAELMGREINAKRQEISDALQQMGGLLTSDQQMSLQRELSLLDNALRQQSINSGNDQFSAQLGFNYADRSSYWDALRRGLL